MHQLNLMSSIDAGRADAVAPHDDPAWRIRSAPCHAHVCGVALQRTTGQQKHHSNPAHTKRT